MEQKLESKNQLHITKRFLKEALLQKQIIAEINFLNKQIADFRSECLILGAAENDDDVL